MAYGLRLINNNRVPAMDGRDWIIDGDPGYRLGRADNLIPQRGRIPREVSHKRAVARAMADPPGATGSPPSRGAGGSAVARVHPTVVKKWLRSHSAPGNINASGVVLHSRAPAAVAAKDTRWSTTQGDLYAPAEPLRNPFPLCKFQNHSERIPLSAKPPEMDARIAATLPAWLVHPGSTTYSELCGQDKPLAAPVSRFALHSEVIPQNITLSRDEHLGSVRREFEVQGETSKVHWFSEATVKQSNYFHHEQPSHGFSNSRRTYLPGHPAPDGVSVEEWQRRG